LDGAPLAMTDVLHSISVTLLCIKKNCTELLQTCKLKKYRPFYVGRLCTIYKYKGTVNVLYTFF